MPTFNDFMNNLRQTMSSLKSRASEPGNSANASRLTDVPGANSGIRDPARTVQFKELEYLRPLVDQDAPGSISMSVDEPDVISYVYNEGDTFGDVIKKLGLETKNGLWGSNGDVAYYTQQLRDQGINGNIPIGTKIKLRKRK